MANRMIDTLYPTAAQPEPQTQASVSVGDLCERLCEAESALLESRQMDFARLAEVELRRCTCTYNHCARCDESVWLRAKLHLPPESDNLL